MIIYSNGKDSSRYVAQKVAEATDDRAIAVDADVTKDIVASVQENNERNLVNDEVLGIVTPVYFGGLPGVMRKYLEQLQVTGIKYCYVIFTYGYMSGYIASQIKKLLKKKGIGLSVVYSVQIPEDYVAESDVQEIVGDDKTVGEDDMIEATLNNIIESIMKREVGLNIRGGIPYYAEPAASAYDNSRDTSRFRVDDSCIGCGLCAKECRMKAIELREGKPVWVKDRCIMCRLCIRLCSEQAIQYGEGKGSGF